MFDIKSLVRKGVPMEDIIELQAEYEREQTYLITITIKEVLLVLDKDQTEMSLN